MTCCAASPARAYSKPVSVRMKPLSLWRTVVATTILAACVTTSAAPQYFGRNKVKYEDFDFRILETEHFDIHSIRVNAPLSSARRLWRKHGRRLRIVFDHELSDRRCHGGQGPSYGGPTRRFAGRDQPRPRS